MKRYDVIVVGAGHNGMVTAGYLARAGLDVLVLERSAKPGGSASNAEFHPGFTGSEGAHAVMRMDAAILNDLDLARHGLDIIPIPHRATIFPDMRVLTTPFDHQAALNGIAMFAPQETESFEEFIRMLQRLHEVADSLKESQPKIIRNRPDRRPGTTNNFLNMWDKLHSGNAEDAIRFPFRSCKDVLDEFFDNEDVKAHIASPTLIGSAKGPFSPGSALSLLDHWAPQAPHGSAGFIRGGTQKLTDSLAASIRASGVEIMTRTEVTQVNLSKGRPVSVSVSDGSVFEADRFISGIDPKRTFLTLFDWKSLPDPLLKQIGRFRLRGSLSKLNLALDRLPAFADKSDARHLASGLMSLSPSMTEMERAYDLWKDGFVPQRPHLEIAVPSVLNPSLVPAGKHVMSVYIQYTPSQLFDGTWGQGRRETLVSTVLNQISQVCPDIESAVLDWSLSTPGDLEGKFSLTDGDIHHGELALDQLLYNRPLPNWRFHRTPLERFYLCGSGSGSDSGLTGLPGAAAAREILKDLGRGPDD